MTPDTITRKQIAQAAGVSEDTVRRKEVEWGIDKFKSTASECPILFFRQPVSIQLLKIRVIIRPL